MGDVNSAIQYLLQIVIEKQYSIPNARINIEITTKKKPKATWGQPGNLNKYTMFVKNAAGEVVMKSAEQDGYNKLYHKEEDWANFYLTLKPIDNVNNT